MAFDTVDLLQNVRDGVYFIDRRRRITFWNRAAERITGYSAEKVLGCTCSDNILIHVDRHGTSLCKTLCPLAKSMNDGESREAHVFLHHKQGHRVPVFVRTTRLLDEKGEMVGGAEFFHDENDRAVMEEKIEELQLRSFLDSLTQLPNRAYADQEIKAKLAESTQFHIPLGLVFLDIDHFKRVNDEYGHAAGDHALKTVANTIRHLCRPFDTWGRWGGEEFVGIIQNIDLDGVSEIAEQLRILVAETHVHWQEKTLKVTVSLGATIAGAEETSESLVARADSLMYQSKKKGRNRLTIG
jgi:diguanylate cyclase (GGDEF)-like protein/PAS domain S-box-containing protein